VWKPHKALHHLKNFWFSFYRSTRFLFVTIVAQIFAIDVRRKKRTTKHFLSKFNAPKQLRRLLFVPFRKSWRIVQKITLLRQLLK